MTETSTLISMPTLKENDEGLAVVVWQRLLNLELAHDPAPEFLLKEKFIELLTLSKLLLPTQDGVLFIAEDGRYYEITRCLTIAFQEIAIRKQLADGIVGARTWCAVGLNTFNETILIGKLTPTKRTR